MDDWGAAAVPSLDDPAADDWRYVPRGMRPLRSRGVLAGIVIVFASAVALTMVLPAFSQ